MPIERLHLTTGRLILRTFQDQDVEEFSRYRSDPEVARWQGWEAPFPVEKAAQFVTEMQSVHPGTPGHWLQVAIVDKDSGLLLGDCAFHVLIEDPTQAEVGFTLARTSQGKGYAQEAGRRLLAYLFRDLNLRRVRAICDVENIASARLLACLGLRHEGRMLESTWFKGRWSSEDWFSILRSEWKNQSAG